MTGRSSCKGRDAHFEFPTRPKLAISQFHKVLSILQFWDRSESLRPLIRA